MDCFLLPASDRETLSTVAMFAAWLPAIILMLVFHNRFIELSRQQWPEPGKGGYFKLAGVIVTVGAVVIFGLVMWMLVPTIFDALCTWKIG